MRLPLSLALVAVLLSAGCLMGGSGDEVDASEDLEQASPGQDTEPEDASAEETSDRLEHAPGWIPGEWWTIEVDSTLIDEPIQWTRVVGGLTAETYLVGQPADEASAAGLLLHVPGLGDVAHGNLSYSVHGTTFTPLQFPLEDEQTWETTFEGDPVTAKANVEGDTVALEYTGSRNITATYDPDVRALTQMDVDDGFITYEVLDHGFAYEGDIEIPRERQVTFIEGRAAGALTASGSLGPPAGQAEVPEEVDRVAFTQIVGNLDMTAGPETGAYLERAVLPNGTTYVTEQAASTEGLTISFHEATNATGTWRFEHVAGGPGLAFTEGIGYQLETRTLG